MLASSRRIDRAAVSAPRAPHWRLLAKQFSINDGWIHQYSSVTVTLRLCWSASETQAVLAIQKPRSPRLFLRSSVGHWQSMRGRTTARFSNVLALALALARSVASHPAAGVLNERTNEFTTTGNTGKTPHCSCTCKLHAYQSKRNPVGRPGELDIAAHSWYYVHVSQLESGPDKIPVKHC